MEPQTNCLGCNVECANALCPKCLEEQGGLPENAFSFEEKRPLTESELHRFLDDIDWVDRQATLEEINDLCRSAKENDRPTKLYAIIDEIRTLTEEFL